ncbi:DUF2914 domain-containing protein [candidate division FCPU426 bacterium]|nr:DUF2914 domain-containing protein [candidate division FCPU426 bacterium]
MRTFLAVCVMLVIGGFGIPANLGAESQGSETQAVGCETKAAAPAAAVSKTKETKTSSTETAPAPVKNQPISQQPETSAPAAAAETNLEVVEIAIAQGIENREPVQVADKFPAGVERLYCYTKIEGGKEGNSITHRWKKGDDVLAEISLNVSGSPWRTYSSKAIMQEWTGTWSVEILQNNVVLISKEFTIE